MMKYIILITLIFLNGCYGPENILKKAQKYEDTQNYDSAEQQYLKIIVKYPKSEIVPEAMYRIGMIYKNVRNDYSQSQIWFNQVITRYPSSKFVPLSQVGILESPDYSGAIDNNIIVLGDVETSGRNMRIKIEHKKLDYNLYLRIQKLFAGEKFMREEKSFYLKTENEIREYLQDPRDKTKQQLKYTIVLKYPLKTDSSWQTYKEGKVVICTVVKDDFTIKLGNKEYKGCIKISEQAEDISGTKYYYYVPNKGCVKITTATKNFPDKEYIAIQLVPEGGA